MTRLYVILIARGWFHFFFFNDIILYSTVMVWNKKLNIWKRWISVPIDHNFATAPIRFLWNVGKFSCNKNWWPMYVVFLIVESNDEHVLIFSFCFLFQLPTGNRLYLFSCVFFFIFFFFPTPLICRINLTAEHNCHLRLFLRGIYFFFYDSVLYVCAFWWR